MIVYIVDNGDDTIIGVFKKKKKAKALIQLGKKRWNEQWEMVKVKLNDVKSWVLAGNEPYRKKRVR